MATIMDSLDNVLPIVLSPGITDSLPDVDPVASRIALTTAGVQRSNFGQDWKVVHVFSTGGSGGFNWTTATGDDTYATPNESVFYNVSRTFPSAVQVSNLGTLQRTLTLRQLNGSYVLPIHILQADALDAATIDYVNENTKQVARRAAQYIVNSLFSFNPRNGTDGTGVLCNLASSSCSTTTISATVGTIGRIGQLYNGMLVDVYNSAGTVQKNVVSSTVVEAVIDNWDPVGKTFKIKTVAGGTFDNASGPPDTRITDGDIVVPRGSLGNTTGGFKGWIKSSGYIFNVASTTDGINLSTYPQFKSISQSVGAALNEVELSKYLTQFTEAYGGLVSLDSMISSLGVMNAYVEENYDAGRYQRQGEPIKIAGGWSVQPFVFNGRKYEWMTSTYMQPGYLWIAKLGNGNLKRYTPPPVVRGGPDGANVSFPQDVQFLNKIIKQPSVFKNLHTSSGATTELFEAPFFMFMEFAPMQPQSIELYGLTESPA